MLWKLIDSICKENYHKLKVSERQYQVLNLKDIICVLCPTRENVFWIGDWAFWRRCWEMFDYDWPYFYLNKMTAFLFCWKGHVIPLVSLTLHVFDICNSWFLYQSKTKRKTKIKTKEIGSMKNSVLLSRALLAVQKGAFCRMCLFCFCTSPTSVSNVLWRQDILFVCNFSKVVCSELSVFDFLIVIITLGKIVANDRVDLYSKPWNWVLRKKKI